MLNAAAELTHWGDRGKFYGPSHVCGGGPCYVAHRIAATAPLMTAGCAHPTLPHRTSPAAGAWWDSTSFMAFSRQWNVPTHAWLLRHVYLDAQRLRGARGGGLLGLSQAGALYLTFAVSLVLHELLLWSTFAPSTPLPYLAILGCAQFPLLGILRDFKATRLGNYVFWGACGRAGVRVRDGNSHAALWGRRHLSPA